MTAKNPFSVASGFFIKEDFYSNNTITTTNVGELGWEFATIGNASTIAYLTGATGGGQAFGVLRDTTAATAAGDGEAYRLDADGLHVNWGGGYVRAKVRLPNVAGNTVENNDFRIGLGDGETAADDTIGIWVRATDGALSVNAHSAANGDNTVNVAAGAVGTLTGGNTLVLGTYHDLELRWFGENASSGPDTVELWVDGYFAATAPCLIGIAEIMEPHFVHWNADATTADSLELDIDYYELCMFRDAQM